MPLSPLGERVARDGAFISRRGTGEGVPAGPLNERLVVARHHLPRLGFKISRPNIGRGQSPAPGEGS